MDPAITWGIRRRRVVDRGDVPKFWVWDEDVADAVALAVIRRARGPFLLVPTQPVLPREMGAIGGFRAVRIPTWLLGTIPLS